MTEKNVLLVEDDEVQRNEISRILKAAGYDVCVAADGREGLARLEQQPHADIILLDMMIQSPGCDGWTFLRLIKQMSKLSTIPVIIVTGLGVATNEWARSLGADCVLKKPFEIKTLLSELGRIWQFHGASLVSRMPHEKPKVKEPK